MLASRNIIRQNIRDGIWTAHRAQTKLTVDDLTIGPHSIDVSLGTKLLVPAVTSSLNKLREVVVDPYQPYPSADYIYQTVQTEGFILEPGDFALGYASERFDCTTPVNIVVADHPTLGSIDSKFAFTQIYDGRSTMGRLGIMSHVTAGYGDYGFNGNFTLELANVGRMSIRLHAGMRLGQVSFHGILGGLLGIPPTYSGAYTAQNDQPVPPVLGRSRFV